MILRQLLTGVFCLAVSLVIIDVSFAQDQQKNRHNNSPRK